MIQPGINIGLSSLKGVVTSAASLIQGVVHHYADDYKGCVQLAVSRLSRVSVCDPIIIISITQVVDCILIGYNTRGLLVIVLE